MKGDVEAPNPGRELYFALNFNCSVCFMVFVFGLEFCALIYEHNFVKISE